MQSPASNLRFPIQLLALLFMFAAPALTFRYHAVDGTVRFEDVLRAE